jgi:hypothetical protein
LACVYVCLELVNLQLASLAALALNVSHNFLIGDVGVTDIEGGDNSEHSAPLVAEKPTVVSDAISAGASLILEASNLSRSLEVIRGWGIEIGKANHIAAVVTSPELYEAAYHLGQLVDRRVALDDRAYQLMMKEALEHMKLSPRGPE